MAVKVGELYAELGLDKKPFDKGLDQTEQQAKGWSTRVGGILKNSAGFLAKWGTIGATAVGGFAFLTGNMASDLDEATNKVKVVFGDMAGDVIDSMDDSAQAFGLSRTAALGAIGTYGNLFTAMGIGSKTSAEMSTDLVGLAADLASFNNIDPTEALDKLRAGLVGETEPLRTLGVNLNQAQIEAKAMEMGLWDGEGAISAAAKAQASYGLILEQTTAAQGDFARTSGGMANQQRILSARIQDAGAKIGEAFLPVIAEILPMLSDAIQQASFWITDNMDTIQAVVSTAFQVVGTVVSFFFTEVLPALANAITWFVENVLPIFTAGFDNATNNVLPALMGAFDVITTQVIPAVAAVITWIVTNILPPLIDTFNTIAQEVIPFLQKAFQFVVDWISDNMPQISSVVGQVAGAVSTAFGVIAGIIQWAWQTFGPIIRTIADIAFPAIGIAASVLLIAIDQAFKLIGGVFEVFGTVAETVFNAVKDIWDGLSGFFSGVWDNVEGVFKGGLNVLIGLINGFIRFLNGLHVDIPRIGIPGTDISIGGGSIDPFNIPQIPRLQTGARNFSGGLAWVGEAGPELVALPRGSDVYSHGTSERMRAGMGGPLIGQQVIHGYTPDEVERQTRRAIRREALAWSLEGR